MDTGTSLENISIEKALSEGVISESDMLEEVWCEEFESLVELSPLVAARAVDHFGGTRVYIPLKVEPDSTLATVLGMAGATTVAKLFFTETLDFPRMAVLRRKIRNRKMAALRSDGWSVTKLALHFHLTERAVYHILSQGREK